MYFGGRTYSWFLPLFNVILFHGGLLSFHTHITKIIIAERTLPLRFVKVNSRKGQNGKFQ